ncbi:3-hydroxyacyl-CoA dehydrogenase [Coccidioides immitis RMSCC 3703]|nr:3-hydroxyacyl-CoA dehydrogenase [Coccidioides immitis RMSCC 3703]
MSAPVAILGAGTQGRRLAYMWSSRGRPVHLIDENLSQLQDAQKAVEQFRKTDSKSEYLSGELKTFASEDLRAALQEAWLVVECVPELLPLKRAVIENIDALTGPMTIIASNSSSFTITEIVAGLELRHPDRFVSLHSYWPPETPAIEIMASPKTKPLIIQRLISECKDHGFSPYHVKKNSTGYIYNRIWAAIKREALSVAAEGVATPEEIDAIYKDVLKTPKGPFEQMDVVGLDVVLDIEEH